MSVAYANLIDAMIGWIRGTPNLVAAFSDEGPSNPAKDKFWPMPVRDGVELPWATYVDTLGDVTYTTGPASIETSAIQWVVVADGKDKAESLVRQLVKTLNDAPLEFMSGRLMYFRAGSPSAVPITNLLPSTPNGYAYAVTINAMVQTAV